MNKRQMLVQQQFLNNEEEVTKRLFQVYSESLEDVTKQAQKLQDEFDELAAIYDNIEDEDEKEILKSRMRSKVYQKQHQESLKKQISGILDNMHENSYKTVADYLDKCYEDGFIGTMYDLQGQGVPLAMPLDQKAMVRAVQLDSPISKGLYNHLGEDVDMLKKHITSQISRGISSGLTTRQIAHNLAGKMTGTYNNPKGAYAYAKRIARTEGHRIQCQGTMDAMYGAKEKGADVVKQWDSTLDGKTRDSHNKVDGEWKELDEKFSNGLKFPGDPSGQAAEVIYCRCALLQRARWALDDSFTKMNNFTKQLEEFESPEDYAEFKKSFFSKENKQYMNYVSEMEKKYGTKDWHKILDAMSDREANHYLKLLESNPMYNKKAAAVDLTKNDNNDIIKSGEMQSIVEGHEIFDTWQRRTDQFDFDIEDVLNAQGFDGLPTLLDDEEFEKAVKESGFVAQRTYSAPTQEVVDAYRDELYHGKWYVDCSTGGAQYGQGMYCAADYSGKITDGMQAEMLHYRSLSKQNFGFEAFKQQIDGMKVSDLDLKYKMSEREFEAVKKYMASSNIMRSSYMLPKEDRDVYNNIGKKAREEAVKKLTNLETKCLLETPCYSHTETITLHKSAKIFTLKHSEDTVDIKNRLGEEYVLKNVKSDKARTMIEKANKLQKDYYADKISMEEHDAEWQKIRNSEMWKNEIQPLYDAWHNKTGRMNEGSVAAMMGYDAINAEGHGASGSYTVILNRTKCIFKKGGA